MAIDRLITDAGETGSQSATDTYDLSGAINGSYQTFADSPLTDSESTYIRIYSMDSDKKEVLEATFSTGTPDQFTRVSTVESSNADSAVDFGNESLHVVGSVTPGQKAVLTDLISTFTELQAFDADVEFEGLGFRQRVEMLAAHLMEDLELEVDEISHGQAASRILGLNSLSSDPADPDAGEGLLWVSDGTGTGTDGDLVYKVTNSAGTTKTFVIGDFSAN